MKISKYKPFDQLSRRLRKKVWIHIKNRIASERHQLGGLFSSDDAFDHPIQVADILFLEKNLRIWNATIRTTRWSYWENVKTQAFARLSERLPDWRPSFFSTKPAQVEIDGLKPLDWLEAEGNRIH